MRIAARCVAIQPFEWECERAVASPSVAATEPRHQCEEMKRELYTRLPNDSLELESIVSGRRSAWLQLKQETQRRDIGS
jgi:hypothetical protein